jgi:hypothetical protein
MSAAGFSIWWVLVPVLAWLVVTLGVTLLRERRKHRAQWARAQKATDILAHGTPATAQVMAFSDTGERRSGMGATWAVATLHLRVQATEVAEAFEVDQTTSIDLAELPDYAAGKTIAVRFDPASRDVAVERSTRSAAYYGADSSRPHAAAKATGA